jgi:uncharacterized protein YxjI
MRFYIKQKVFSIRDKFRIMDETQRELYTVEGKFFSIQNKLELLNMNGSQVLNASKKVFTLMPKYSIFTPHGDLLAQVHRKFALRPKFIVYVNNEELEVEGSFFGHSFGVMRNGQEVASISKKVISWGDTYEINIADELNTELYLFIVIIIDQIIHEQENKRRNN